MDTSRQRIHGTLRFRWLGSGPVPASLDLRRCGWLLDERQEPGVGCIGVIDAGDLDSVAWMGVLSAWTAEVRRGILVAGVRRPHERARLLDIGFGDALNEGIDIGELSARADRVNAHACLLPRLRDFGPLQLDLLAREAYAFDEPLNLNPREFALLWRLTDSPNQIVSKQALVQDVWRLGFMPQTNSIAVHMSRLRRKLGFAGLRNMLETASQEGYRLRIPHNHGKVFRTSTAEPPRRAASVAAPCEAAKVISAQA
ncbi:winged helix-turn-helix domain-containing protein [Novosphingobium sp.]|uniref:winged helix-turn-helix domain-containing protein n=1 Tax=Novosphingobium sp. TaxID=1874826 RepID=UPI002B47C07D|nr:winged helix-turn-helix domain-containing protein [Novosphingobium sp.]HKR93587.1 winged helix-turn-helix domain-containing protein [Novosphingobium sp.]